MNRKGPLIKLGMLLAIAAAGAQWGCSHAGSEEPASARAADDPAARSDSVTTSSRKYTKPSDEELRRKLTSEQYAVTQKESTEPPFRNDYWDNHEHGIYVDVVSGEPLFSSLDKFDSGTGWPSFTRPLEAHNVAEHTDYKMILPRTEVRSKHGESHLGHVFEDGPQPTGMRYCINSAALRFVPASDLEKEGYGEYRKAFEAAGILAPSSGAGKEP